MDKFLAAMKGKIDEVEGNLPAEFNDAKVQKIIAWVEEKDQTNIIDKLKKEIDEISAEYEILKAKAQSEPKPPSVKKQSSEKKKNILSKPENSKSKNGGFSAETMFKDMISQIKNRIRSIKFRQNDFQTFSEVQGQIDLLLFDANTELHAIKKSITKKFDNVQAKDAPAKKNVRRMRRPRRNSSNDERRPNDGRRND